MKTLTRTFKVGMYLFHENDRSRELYILQSGKVKITRKAGNKEVELAVLGAGAVLGEMALIDGKPRSASVKVVEECTAILIGADSLDQKIRGVPPWFVSIIKMTCQKIRLANQRLKAISGEHQTANIIISLKYLFDTYDKGEGILYQDTMLTTISLINITEQNFKRAVEFLVQHKLIRYTETTLRIVDKTEFEHYCNFLRDYRHNLFEKNPPLSELCSRAVEKLSTQVQTIIDQSSTESVIDSALFLKTVTELCSSDSVFPLLEELKNADLVTIRKKENPPKDSHPIESATIITRKQLWYRTYLALHFSKVVPTV